MIVAIAIVIFAIHSEVICIRESRPLRHSDNVIRFVAASALAVALTYEFFKAIA